MRAVLVTMLLTLVAAGCGTDDADGGPDDDGVPAWVTRAEIARTPDGATLLWDIDLDESGEDGTLTWELFAANGRSLAEDVLDYEPWRVRAYDGGFLVVSGAETPYASMMTLDAVTGEVTEPALLDESRPVQPGDIAVNDFGFWAFRPADRTVAAFPGPPLGDLSDAEAGGGLLPAAIEDDGVITVVAGERTNPRYLHRSPDGGNTWTREQVRLPDGIELDVDRIFTDGTTTALALVEKSVPVGLLVHHDGSWRLSPEFRRGLGHHGVTGLAGGRVLLVPNHGVGGSGYLGDRVVPTRLTAVDADELRALSDGLASMSPEPRFSDDGGQTWEPLALDY
jgi:hypothetical protein